MCVLASGDTHRTLEARSNLGVTKCIITVRKREGFSSPGQSPGLLPHILRSRCRRLLYEPKFVRGKLLAPFDGLINVPD